MKKVIVIYGPPADPAGFDRYYAEIHVPLVKKMPHLASFEVSRGPVAASDGKPLHLVAVLTFASQADMDAAFGSEEGKAAVADVANFATGGATLVSFDTETLA